MAYRLPSYGSGLACFVAVACGGCTLVSDLERFQSIEDAAAAAPGRSDAGKDAAVDGDAAAPDDAGTGRGDAGQGPGLTCENPRTLCVRLEAFTPHVNELTVVDLVSEDDNLRARAVLDPLNGIDPTADVVMPLAIPEIEVPAEGATHPLHLQVWADEDNDGAYTPEGDHDWIIPLPADGNRLFQHSSAFRDLIPRPRSIGGDFVMRLSEMTIHEGKMLEVMVIEDATDRTVGLYRLQRIPEGGELTIEIPGIIDTGDAGGIAYRVEFYADHNGNRTYDDPTADHTWLRLVESGSDGVSLEFTHGTEFTPLDYQFDFEE